jgi:putative salt-induced outer membrane protein
MRYYVLLTTVFTMLTVSPAQAALPEAIDRRLKRLCGIDDTFIRYAVIKELRRQFPEHGTAILDHWPVTCQQDSPDAAPLAGETTPPADPPATPAIQEEVVASAALAETQATDSEKPKPAKPLFSGTLESGVDIRTGNTDKAEFNFAGSLVHERQYWRNTLTGSLYNSEENDNQIAEEYRLRGRSDYKFNERDYAFASLQYVDDRFSGFDYRLTEVVGVGRHWIDREKAALETRLGAGMRQSALIDGENSNDLLLELVIDGRISLNRYLTLSEEFTTEYASDATIFNSLTAIKSRITDTLSLQTSLMVEHITDVPVGSEQTDTRTNVGVVYAF